jgi:diguanylate cyclase (GGDEF)-like protein
LTLFRPAAALAGRLRYAQKFLVVGLVLIIPLAVVAWAYVDLQRAQIAFSAKERQGVAYLGPLMALTDAVVEARHVAVTRPDRPVPDLSRQIGLVDAADARVGAELTVSAGRREARRLTTIAQSSRGTALERYALYNAAATALLALVVQVGDESNLTLDPDLDSYYLMDTLQFRLPVLLDTAGRAVDRTVLARAGTDTDVFVELGLDSGVLASTRAAVAHAARTVATRTRDARVREITAGDFARLDATTADLAELLAAAGQGRRIASIRPDAGDAVRHAAATLAADAAEGLDVLLRARIDEFSDRAERVEALTGFGAALALYLFVGFYLSVTPPIRRIVATLHAVADGDLARRVSVDTHDELSDVARTLNETIAQTEVATRRLAERAIHDALTGLPNRTLALDRLQHALSRHRMDGGVLAVLFVDLDRFKIINDTLGHEVGDEVLRVVAGRLGQAARRSDTVCRLAGDEFVVVSEDLARPEDAVAIGERFVTDLSRPITVQRGREVSVGASVGVAYDTTGLPLTAEEMLRHADMAMYRAKQRGRGRVETFDDTLRVALEQRVSVEDELRHGIEAGQLRVFYQPIVAADDTAMAGYEALVRWQHPTRGLLGPGEFIDVAEETGLIVPLGAAVLTEACRQFATWRATLPGYENAFVSVNVSPTQFGLPTFVPTLARVLGETGLDPDALWLEITETAIMADEAVARETLAAVCRLGVHLSVDDFGTGYSPLTYLRWFPVEALKIDRGFVDGLGRDSEDEAIVTMVLALARSLGLRTVAEGVENEAQAVWLSQRGCTALQGFHFGRPVPAREIEAAARTPVLPAA